MVFVKKSVANMKRKISEVQKARHEANRANKKLRQGEPTGIGRRIFDLDLLAQDFWCSKCEIGLSSRFLESETVHGLASVYKIRCNKCLVLYTVQSSSPVPAASSSGRLLYAVNCKFAMGKLLFSIAKGLFLMVILIRFQ